MSGAGDFSEMAKKKVKVFLSSTTKDLTEARSIISKKINRVCKSVELVSYDDYKDKYPEKSDQDLCVYLVSRSNAIILLVDQYYGTTYRRNKKISITHAELKRAKRHKLVIIPIIRTQTWHEYQVWKRNKPHIRDKIRWPHVQEKKIFSLINEVGSANWQKHSNFDDRKASKEIINAVEALALRKGYGSLKHMVLK